MNRSSVRPMIHCANCGQKPAADADSPHYGMCPTCGASLQITCTKCAAVSSGHAIVKHLFHCPQCRDHMSIPGPSIGRVRSTAGAQGNGKVVRRLALAATWIALTVMGYFGAMAWHASTAASEPQQTVRPAR